MELMELAAKITSGAEKVIGNPYTMLILIIISYFSLWKVISEFKRDFEETKAQNKRWSILTFARSCRNGELHSREEWKHAISELAEYEAYTEKKKIENGVIEEDAKYLRELYHERNVKNDFV